MAVMGTSAYAVCPGPDHITPWRYNGDPTPEGDDGGFDVPSESPTDGTNAWNTILIVLGPDGLFGSLFFNIVIEDNHSLNGGGDDSPDCHNSQ
jgi:hypothetical protein